jgi:WD40 repeat protein
LGTTRLRHEAEVTFVDFGPRGTTLVTAGRDGTIRLWDLASGKELRRFARPKALPLKGDKGGKGGKQSAEDALQMMFQGRNGGGRSIVAVSPDGTTLAAAADNAVQLWEVPARSCGSSRRRAAFASRGWPSPRTGSSSPTAAAA